MINRIVPGKQLDPEFYTFFTDFALEEVPAQSALDDRTRYMALLAALLGAQGTDEYSVVMLAALHADLTPVEIKEILYQSVAYLGIGRVRPFFKVTNDVLESQGIDVPLEPQATVSPDTRLEAGIQKQIDLFGESMKTFIDDGPESTKDIRTWLADNCFGDYYTRGGLTDKTREMITFCFLAALGGCEPQLKAHIAANIRLGNDKAFLTDVILQCVPYIGYPRVLNALTCIEESTPCK